MTFDVAADSYDRFMGRYSQPLAVELADAAGISAGQRALDVGCGPGALAAVLVSRLGADAVAAVDPSEPFVAAARSRLPGVDVRRAVAEDLPFPDSTFDATLAELVVHFMTDPVAGLREMARVTRPGGTVAACVWDLAGKENPLATFWAAVRDLHPAATDESGLAGARDQQLVELATSAGLQDVTQSVLTVSVRYESFEEWWQPFTLGVGPSGSYVTGLDEVRRDALRDHCAQLLPEAPFDIVARAWCVRCRVGA